jgi:aspartyl-tRNA(Asn)/glutamyl-tRNA(Gln) amidotransferase subunit A
MRQAAPADVFGRLRDGVSGLRIGVIRELVDSADTNTETRACVRAAAEVFGKLGARLEDVSLPLVPLAGAVFMALGDSEGSGLHQTWLRERAHEYDVATRRRLLAASLLPTAAFHQAARARTLITREALGALERFDLLLAPTQPGPAPLIANGRKPVTSKEDAGGRFFTRRSYTTPFNLAAMPAISIPCGFTTNGLPIGLQLAGRRYDEATVLRAAWAYEQATPWHERRPPER